LSNWQTVCKVKDVGEGTPSGVEIQDKKLLVVRTKAGYFVLDAVCPHMGGDLSRGKIVDGSVICPRHGSTYELASGKLVKDVGGAIRWLTRKGGADIKSYPVRVDGLNLMADLG
jgi:nitrite reductase/ring-hydroxylating ferredoxin subunit